MGLDQAGRIVKALPRRVTNGWGGSMKATFFRGVVLGAVVSGVTLVSSVALAGTGVGGVFNLGKSNAVDATTTLTGSTKGPQLQVSNSSTGAGAAGLGITVAQGKPPLKVSSSTKVKKLNADLLDGVSSASFQRSITGSCASGTAISDVLPDGSVSCSRSTVYAIAATPAAGAALFQTFPPSGLELAYECHELTTGVRFANFGSGGSTLNWMFSEGGTSSTVNASGASIDPNHALTFVPPAGRIEGQWIFAESGTSTTVHLHFFDGGDFCEARGTVEVALTS
jgi:hypothetical protein